VDVQAALARFKDVRVRGMEDGVPYSVTGNLGTLKGVADKVGALRMQEDARAAVEDIAPVFRVSGEDLVFKRATVDEQGHRHLRFQQTLNGLRVVGGELVLHTDGAGNIYAANGSARSGEQVSAAAKVAPEAALKAAMDGSTARGASAQGASLVYVRAEHARDVQLAYEVRVKGERDGMPADDLVYVDAQRGGILLVNPLVHSALNRKVYTANNGTTTPGTLKRSEGGAAVGDTHIDTNYDRLGQTYTCYKDLFARDSIDNAGGTLISTVHYSTNYVNAYWDGTQMVYGDGNGVDSTMLGLDLDVTVHELTHAVTSNESNLTYSGESGGLNESMSDIFAGVCESYFTGTWATTPDIFMIGEDIWTPATPNDALRYMDDPAKDGSSLDFYADYGGQDVHYSSGISNLVFAMLSKGGTHPRGKSTNVVPAIGVEKAGRIFYKANTDLFTASTTFEQAKTYTVQAAEALYGVGSAESAAVTEAWKAVGVPPPPPVINPLSSGVAVSIAGSSGSKKYYSLDVPAGKSSLTFAMSGGTGDADLYVKFGALPTASTYDCRPYTGGNAESCPFTNPAAGTWYVMVNGYSTYSGATLTGTYSGTGGGTGTPVSTTVSGSVASSQNVNYPAYSVVAGTQFKVVMSGTGDPDLYVRFGAAPTTTTYNCRPYASGAAETCDLTVPAGQTSAYVMVRGYTAATYTLNINYTKP
jgi:Zn-dependent metalloprotease